MPILPVEQTRTSFFSMLSCLATSDTILRLSFSPCCLCRHLHSHYLRELHEKYFRICYQFFRVSNRGSLNIICGENPCSIARFFRINDHQDPICRPVLLLHRNGHRNRKSPEGRLVPHHPRRISW